MPLRYLALGDSYTIGTGASRDEHSFPSCLSRRYQSASGRPMQILNLGVNGYTTEDLIRDELPRAASFGPAVVSVLIGVNDWVQGAPVAHYAANLDLIHGAVGRLDIVPGGVVAVSIPDFSYTESGTVFGSPDAIATGLREFNRVARAAAESSGFTWVDIFNLSRSRIGSPGWIGGDGLHPSDLQYEAWAEAIWAAVGPRWAGL